MSSGFKVKRKPGTYDRVGSSVVIVSSVVALSAALWIIFSVAQPVV
jgi:hypothetical protein